LRLGTLLDQISKDADGSRVVIHGNFNIDLDRVDDGTYYMATLAKSLAECTAAAGLETHATSPTFRSFGNFTSDATPRLPLVGCSLRVRRASPTRRGAYPPGTSKAASDVASETLPRLPVDVASPAGGGPSPAGGGPSPAGGSPSPAGDGQSQAGDFHRHARLDHIYTKGFISESKVMPDSTIDHRPGQGATAQARS
jgi:hypothetical protein